MVAECMVIRRGWGTRGGVGAGGCSSEEVDKGEGVEVRQWQGTDGAGMLAGEMGVGRWRASCGSGGMDGWSLAVESRFYVVGGRTSSVTAPWWTGAPRRSVTELVTRRDERRTRCGDMMMIRNNQLILEIALTPIGHRSLVSSSVPKLFPAITTGHILPDACRPDSVCPAKRSSIAQPLPCTSSRPPARSSAPRLSPLLLLPPRARSPTSCFPHARRTYPSVHCPSLVQERSARHPSIVGHCLPVHDQHACPSTAARPPILFDPSPPSVS